LDGDEPSLLKRIENFKIDKDEMGKDQCLPNWVGI
jgi:hypothetical protein